MLINSDFPLSPQEGFKVVGSSGSINISGTGLTDILDVTSEIGVLSSVAIQCVNSGAYALEIEIDGQTTESIPIYTGGTGTNFHRAYNVGGASLTIVIPIGVRYNSSCRVGINVSVAGSGTVYVAVTRGVKV